MLDNRYLFESSPDLLTFEFDSIGPKGIVTKVVHYTEINVHGFYNLGFGDKDPLSGYISDMTVTNNGDSQKVLATVARTLYLFMEHYLMPLYLQQAVLLPVQDFTKSAFRII